MDSDNAWKDIIEELFPEFLDFFFPAVHRDIDFGKCYEFLDNELHRFMKRSATRKRIVDTLVKVYFRSGRETWLLLHVEIQGYRQRQFARRVYLHSYRIFDRLSCNVVSVVVLTDADPNFRRMSIESAVGGFRSHSVFRWLS